MKKISTLFALLTLTFISNAQFSANFDNGISNLSGNCWTFNQIEWTNAAGDIITGTGSLYSNPPVNSSSTRDFYTPALNITSTSLNVSFDYKLSSKISGNATRTIEIGLVNTANNFTSLQLITLDKNTPTTVQNFNNTFTVTTGLKKIVIKIGGTTGDGNTRLIIDNFYTDANPKYNGASNCNTAPVAVNDIFTGIIGVVLYGNVLNNDSDANGETITPSIVTTSPDGIVILNPNGSFSFTPNIGFTGTTTTFTYRITDNGFDPMSSNDALVTINLSAPSTLPVKLASFNGNLNNKKVTLQWVVAENEIADMFEVEKSFDGTTFTTAALVFGSDKTGTENYQFSETMNTEKIFYRLRMTDKNQVVTYSKILMFQTASVTDNKNIKIVNNPATDRLTFNFELKSNQKVDVRVVDLSGRIQMKQVVNGSQGNNYVSMQLAPVMQSGIYIVDVIAGADRYTAKFVKQ